MLKNHKIITGFGIDVVSPAGLIGLQKNAKGDYQISYCEHADTYTQLEQVISVHDVLGTAIPNQYGVFKQLLFDSTLTEHDINLLLSHQPAYYFGDFAKATAYDFRCIGLSDNDVTKQNVVVMLAQQCYLDELCAGFINKKFNLHYIDHENYAIARCIDYLFPHHANNFVVFKCDQHTLQCIVFQQALQTYSHYRIVEDDFLLALQSSWKLLQLHSFNLTFDAYYVLGNAKNIVEKQQQIEKILGMNTMLVDPFSTIPFLHHGQYVQFQAQGPAFVVACGLALRSIKYGK